ncbi:MULTISPECIES: protein kinase [unclassified Streptomyces]|uniref:protein kinase n=1 Tax=unclassified Streptomyces TaxID=2593676 RepID=UPI003823C930
MDDYAGRVLADRYRLPSPPADEFELTETRAFDTYSGQEVLIRQVPLPEVVEAEVLDAEGLPDGFTARDHAARRPAGRTGAGASTRRPADPVVRRAVEAAQAAASIPDHPRLDQVFDVFAEGGSLWVVSELVSARPLSALLAEKPLSPYRAAEVASDVLMALSVLHAHGWTHRNITARTVLVCDDGRVMLTGLAVGAAEEALCGYDPVPVDESQVPSPHPGGEADGGRGAGGPALPGTFAGPRAEVPGPVGGPRFTGPASHGGPASPGGPTPHAASAHHGGPASPPAAVAPALPAAAVDPEAARRAAIEARAAGGLPSAGPGFGTGTSTAPGVGTGPANGPSGAAARRTVETGGDVRAARAGAIAAYRAGARAAARVQESQQQERPALPGARTPVEGDSAPGAGLAGGTVPPYALGAGREPGTAAVGGTPPPGQIVDPYGVRGAPGSAALGTGAIPVPPQAVTPPHAHPLPPAHMAPQALTPPHGVAPPQAVAPSQALTPPQAHSAPQTVVPPQGVVPPQDAVFPHAVVPPQGLSGARWGEPEGGAGGVGVSRRGPTTALAAERARQARMAVVGPVTERWAPEQAGPVHENWQLAAPIGPATDLWALGALLFRSVQGHAPYPEDSTAELVQLVCAEPPAFAEECGPLRPVVESLLRQDPTDRLAFEELRGWLRSLVRSAPEPEAGTYVVATPPSDPRRLPIVRRKGELVRRRRGRAARVPAAPARHKRAAAPRESDRSPRSLGRTLLVLILLGLVAAVAYAVLFLPGAGEEGDGGAARPEGTGAAGQPGPAPDASSEPRPDEGGTSSAGPSASASDTGGTETQSGSDVPAGFTLRDDPEGFRVAVANGWQRTPKNGRGQVVYTHAGFELIVVPGRDTAARDGDDPMVYQREKERELQPYRDSSWATASGLRTIQVGGRTMAEGQFTWTGGDGRELFVRNLALLLDGRYHVVQLRGPEAERDEVTRLFDQASASYRYTG